jgi:hypothetical protein
LDTQVIFTRDDEIQRILVHGQDNQICYVLGLLDRYHNSLILIFESIIRVVLNYTQHGRVSPTPEESVGALDPHHRLNMCMDGDDRR